MLNGTIWVSSDDARHKLYRFLKRRPQEWPRLEAAPVTCIQFYKMFFFVTDQESK